MCAYSISWNESSPVGSSTNANTLDTEVQDLKKSVRERMNQLLDSSTAWETDGDDPKLLDVLALAGTPEVAVVFNSGTVSVPASTLTSITWDSETLDTGGFHSTSTNTQRFTIVEAGYYRLFASIQVVAGAGTAVDVTLNLNKNGSVIRLVLMPTIASDLITMYMNEIVLAAANDFYDLTISHSSSVTYSVTGTNKDNSTFQIERINGTT